MCRCIAAHRLLAELLDVFFHPSIVRAFPIDSTAAFAAEKFVVVGLGPWGKSVLNDFLGNFFNVAVTDRAP